MSMKCNQCKEKVRTRSKLLSIELKKWAVVNRRETQSLRKLIDSLKLRMKRRQFDRSILNLESHLRKLIVVRQNERFQKRIGGMVRKKEINQSKFRQTELHGVIVKDSDLNHEV